MIIKSKQALEKMRTAGKLLADIFEKISPIVREGVSTAFIDAWIEEELQKRQLVSQSKGYKGYRHVSCISVNDVVVHGIPSEKVILQKGDLVKVDVCAAWQLYCADMARSYVVGFEQNEHENHLILIAQQALDKGIAQAAPGKRLYDISAAVQEHVERYKYGVVRDFAGHGIGRHMHEEPDVPNFGTAGTGMRLQVGMTFAIEPMITQGSYEVYVDRDGWTVRTKDKSLAVHVEDTVLVGENGPEILTRLIQ
ncbi:MAG: type I methionyl aminopeptidase [Candidatus Dependentiae bacterium]|nr:type I methionyl aminopeptidase [Candidatus Dependentiae bacterium]